MAITMKAQRGDITRLFELATYSEQQIIAEGDPAQVAAVVGALRGLTEALRSKLEGEDAPE